MQRSVLIGMASSGAGHGALDTTSSPAFHERGNVVRGRGVREERGRGRGGARGRGGVGGNQERTGVKTLDRRVLLGSPPKSCRSPGQ